MPCMFVTLDVSKLSGWLNAVAPCRVERRVCDAEREVWAGRRQGMGWRRRKRRVGRGPTKGCGGQGHVRSAR
eukprot:scaffold42180_cov51-Phaeocystis_antarctica.AAC.1